MYHILKSNLYFGQPWPKFHSIIESKEELDLFLQSLKIVKQLNNDAYKNVVLDLVENNNGSFITYLIEEKDKTLFCEDYQLFIVEVNENK